MTQRGWAADPEGRAAFPGAKFGAFERAASPDFVARVIFHPTFAHDAAGKMTSGITADVGVTYTTSDRLQWVLIGEPSRDGVFDDVVEMAGVPERIRFVENDEVAIDLAVSRLIDLVDIHALAFALEHGSIDALL